MVLSGQWTWIFCEGEKLVQMGYFQNSDISMFSANVVRVEIHFFFFYLLLIWPTKILQKGNPEGFKLLFGTNRWSFLCYVDIKHVGGAIFADTLTL